MHSNIAPRTIAATAPRHARVVWSKTMTDPQDAYWESGQKTVVIPAGWEVCARHEPGAVCVGALQYDYSGVEYSLRYSGSGHSYRNLYIRRRAA